MKRKRLRMAAAVAALLACAGAVGRAQVATDALNRAPEVQSAFRAFYSMDYDLARTRFEHIAAEHPQDPLATDFVLSAVLIPELNRLDLLDTTFYANDGFLTGKHTVVEDPAVRDRILAVAGTAVQQADAQLAVNPRDQDALHARAYARALQAVYVAMVERKFPAALKLAIAAKNDDEQVLKQDPRYTDADLVVGAYQYVVGALPWSFRMVVGLVGISGSREKGMALLRTAGAQGVSTSVDARTIMMLFLRREAKYGQALETAGGLAEEYPHNYLMQLELANLEKDSGSGPKAIVQYRHVLEQAGQPGYFHNAHLELSYFGLGDTLRGEKQYKAAAEAYRDGAAMPTVSPELKQRCLLAAGKSLDLMHDHAEAARSYQQVIDAGRDTAQAQEAGKLIRSPFQGA